MVIHPPSTDRVVRFVSNTVKSLLACYEYIPVIRLGPSRTQIPRGRRILEGLGEESLFQFGSRSIRVEYVVGGI